MTHPGGHLIGHLILPRHSEERSAHRRQCGAHEAGSRVLVTVLSLTVTFFWGGGPTFFTFKRGLDERFCHSELKTVI